MLYFGFENESSNFLVLRGIGIVKLLAWHVVGGHFLATTNHNPIINGRITSLVFAFMTDPKYAAFFALLDFG